MNADFLRAVINANVRYDLIRVNARPGWPNDQTVMKGYNFPAHHHYHFTFRTDLSPAYRSTGERWFRMYYTVPLEYPAHATPAEMSEWRKQRIAMMDNVTMYDCIGSLIERAQFVREIYTFEDFIEELGYLNFDGVLPSQMRNEVIRQLRDAKATYDDAKDCDNILREAFQLNTYYKLISIEDWRVTECGGRWQENQDAIDMMTNKYPQFFPDLNGEVAQASIEDAISDELAPAGWYHPSDEGE
tara:strand:- start:749 stop:1480 length:732 start_codon:yes stop_codon:yes gene_type:complete